jgi:hypothetical protein
VALVHQDTPLLPSAAMMQVIMRVCRLHARAVGTSVSPTISANQGGGRLYDSNLIL